MMRTIDFTERYSPDELAQALIGAGFGNQTSLSTIATGKWDDDDVDDEIELTATVDEDDVIEALGDEAILTAARDIDSGVDEVRSIDDAIRYVRDGDFSLAMTMFERVFEHDGERAAVARALA